MRGMRGVGLALVYERAVGVKRVAEAISASHDTAACHNHEPRVGRQIIRGAKYVVIASDQRIVSLERHNYRAIATVVDLVQTMVKELTEDREQTVKWRREAHVCGHVLNEQSLILRYATKR